MPTSQFHRTINCNQEGVHTFDAIRQTIQECPKPTKDLPTCKDAVAFSVYKANTSFTDTSFTFMLDNRPSMAASQLMQLLIDLLKKINPNIEAIHQYFLLTYIPSCEPIRCLEDYVIFAAVAQRLHLNHLKILIELSCCSEPFSPYNDSPFLYCDNQTFLPYNTTSPSPFYNKRYEIYLPAETSFVQLLTIFDTGIYQKISRNREKEKGEVGQPFPLDANILLYFSSAFHQVMYCQYAADSNNACPQYTYYPSVTNTQNTSRFFSTLDDNYLKPALAHEALSQHSSIVCHAPQNASQIINLYHAYNSSLGIPQITFPHITCVMLTRAQLNAFNQYNIPLQKSHIEKLATSPSIPSLLPAPHALRCPATELHLLSQDEIISLTSDPDTALPFAYHLQLSLINHPKTMTYPAGKELLETLSDVLTVAQAPEDYLALSRRLLETKILDEDSLILMRNNIDASLHSDIKSTLSSIDQLLQSNCFQLSEIYSTLLQGLALLEHIYDDPLSVYFHENEWAMSTPAIVKKRYSSLLNYPLFMHTDMHTSLFPLVLSKAFTFSQLIQTHSTPLSCMGAHYKSFSLHDGNKYLINELMYHDLFFHTLKQSHQVDYASLTDLIQREACYRHLYPMLKWMQLAENNASWGDNFNRRWTQALQQCNLTQPLTTQNIGADFHKLCAILVFMCTHETLVESSGMLHRLYDAPIPTLHQFLHKTIKIFTGKHTRDKEFKLRSTYVDWATEPPAGYDQLPLEKKSPIPLFLAAAWTHFCIQSFANGCRDFTTDQHLENFFTHIHSQIALRAKAVELLQQNCSAAITFINKCWPVQIPNLTPELIDFHKAFDPSCVDDFLKLVKCNHLT